MTSERARSIGIPALLLFAAALGAPPASGAGGRTALPDDIRAGVLLIRAGEHGALVPAPLLDTDVSIRVAGVVARTRVTQRFANPTDLWLEAVYAFPLPELAAVDRMRMRSGGRVIEGLIRERAQARASYARAKREGRRASLVEQERPNLFTTSLANLEPGGELEVEIEYQETLRFDGGGFELHFPMTVAPRYVPGAPLNAASERAPRGFGVIAATARVSDAARVTPALWHPESAPIHPVRLRIDLDAGFALERLASPTHALEIDRLDSTQYSVSLAGGAAPADRDFVLRFAPARGAAPHAALFSEERDGETYLLLLVLPPSPEAAAAHRAPRESVFVIDTSGSMGGASIEQARSALLRALARLEPEDRFNVIAFDTRPRALFAASRRADAKAVRLARHFVERLRASGGTEMGAALELALSEAGAAGASGTGVRQVVFITDGSVANETEIFHTIERRLGRSRLFPIGIGSAPNAFLLARAARLGRGTSTSIHTAAEVGDRMAALFAKLESPVLHDLELHWNDRVEQWPRRLPDLYAGEPVVVTARVSRFAGEVVLAGRSAGRPVELRLPLEPGAPVSGIAKLFARSKIAALAGEAAAAGDPEAARPAILETALRHEIVSRYTSLVAVERTPVRPASAPAATAAVPAMLPHGADPSLVPGVLPRTATPAGLYLRAGALLLLAGACLGLARRWRPRGAGGATA